MAKLKTPEQKERDRNNRLLRTYGISLAEYEEMLVEQNRGCKICGSGGGARSLHVDHDHKWKQIKVAAVKESTHWLAYAAYRGYAVLSYGRTKSEAVKAVRERLKRLSVRGLVCWPDNRLLRMAYDQSERLAKAAEYLREFQTFTASATTKGESV